MKRKVEAAVERIVKIVRTWRTVEAVVIGEALSEDFYDPYFFLSIDVYMKGAPPAPKARMKAFPLAAAFETSDDGAKDRFLDEEIAVRLEYRDLSAVRELIKGKRGFTSMLKSSGTYFFHRVMNGELVYKRSAAFGSLRTALAELPEEIWDRIRCSSQSHMEHYVSDLGAAVIRNDPLFFVISMAGFVKSACSALFAANRRFEPSARLLGGEVLKLARLPEPFRGRLDNLLRFDSDAPPARKHEIAQLMAKSIMALG
jgi:hypothetical protein